MDHPPTARRLVTLLVFFLMASRLDAKYLPPPLFDLLGGSDLVAVGTISEVRHRTFVLELETVAAGDTQRTSAVIRKYEDWVCSSRWLPYRAGQRVVVFAETAEATRDDFTLRSAGAEGEFPIVDGAVMVHGYRLEGLPEANLKGLPAHAVPLDTFLDAVRGLQRCFLVEWDSNHWPSARQICPETELIEFREASALHRYLAKTALQYRPR